MFVLQIVCFNAQPNNSTLRNLTTEFENKNPSKQSIAQKYICSKATVSDNSINLKCIIWRIKIMSSHILTY